MEQLNDTKKMILDIGLKLFSEKGFNATSIRQIAREVGVRESAIYNHFKGKDEIIKTLFELYGVGKVRSYIRKLANDEKLLEDPYHFLKNIASEEILDLVCNEQTNKFKKIVIMEMFCEKNARYIIEREVFQQARELLEEMFHLLINKKLIKDINPTLLANEFLAPLAFINLEHLIVELKEQDKEYYKNQIVSHIDFFWNAIKLD